VNTPTPPLSVSAVTDPNGAVLTAGVSADGKHVCVIVSPLYLDFVEVLICQYTPTGGVLAVRHDRNVTRIRRPCVLLRSTGLLRRVALRADRESADGRFREPHLRRGPVRAVDVDLVVGVISVPQPLERANVVALQIDAAVADASPDKHGRRMPGTDIPIISPDDSSPKSRSLKLALTPIAPGSR